LAQGFQRYEWKGKNGKPYRDSITLLRRVALLLQVVGFAVGVAALGSFTALNLGNVEKPTKTSNAAAQPARQNTSGPATPGTPPPRANTP
jgi:hypothetical protein